MSLSMAELVQDVGQSEQALGERGDDLCNSQIRKGRQWICGVCGRERDRVQVTGHPMPGSDAPF